MYTSAPRLCRHALRCLRPRAKLDTLKLTPPVGRISSKYIHRCCKHQHKVENAAANSTIIADEVTKFGQLAGEWWNEAGEVKPLHALNELRVPMIVRGLEGTGVVGAGARATAGPLRGLRVLDVGCGGGILSEPLARLGADVTGIDAAADNIQVAELHAASDIRLRCARLRPPQYRCCTVEQLAEQEPAAFDAVVASEVLEHVDNQKLFVDCCCRLIKPGGSLFVTTLNRSRAAWLLAIVTAESLFRILPVGTHDWQNFIRPDELHALVADNGFSLVLEHGMRYNPLTSRWSWVATTQVSYALHAVAPPP